MKDIPFQEFNSSSRAFTDWCLTNIRDDKGEGARTFTRVYAETARACADFADRMQTLGIAKAPLGGIPISVKDLFDVQGETTLAGSRALANARPAAYDAEIVRRLRQAGAIIIGKTNMTEFAFSGLGINPHYGTPANPWRREEKRIPGGSSSGAAISVTDGMALAAIGTDTGGSVRIPAALCGLVGFKPTARTVPTAGTLPLSKTFDSIGPLARDVDTCAKVYDILSGSSSQAHAAIAPSSITLAVAKNYVLEQMDSTVAHIYEAILRRLSSAGIKLRETSFPVFDQLPTIFTKGGVVAAEAFAWHQRLLSDRGDLYDPRVIVRIKRGEKHSAGDYLALLEQRQRLIDQWRVESEPFNAVVMPTVPIVPPTIRELEEEDSYNRTNLLVLRNTTIANALDGCAITLPCGTSGDAPAGLMLMGANGSDRSILALAKTLENIVAHT